MYSLSEIINNPLLPAYFSENPPISIEDTVRPCTFLEMDEGLYMIGHKGESFAFDNEYGRHKIHLDAYGIHDRLITNGEYMEFIDAGGYNNWQHWLSEGWDWLKKNSIEAPMYWRREGEEWYYYTLRGYRKIDLSAPVSHVSYYEAEAYASWQGKRLPTESEWEAAAVRYAPEIEEESNLLDSFNYMALPAGQSRQFYGDVWEWTGSAYLPYPKYNKPPGAIGEYNGKFMINQMVLRGGSCATPFTHIRPTYRNFFQAEKRWQFKGFRLAE
jgi:ergothioneine biosynthesis protein EgtB